MGLRMAINMQIKSITEPLIDTFSGCLRKSGEEICGSLIETTRDGTGVTAVLTDGAGGGIRANIAATFVSHMAFSLLQRGCGVMETVATVAQTLPVKDTQTFFTEDTQTFFEEDTSTFYGEDTSTIPYRNTVPGLAVLRLDTQGGFSASSFNLPHLCCLRRGKLLAAGYRPIVGAEPAEECSFPIKSGDTFVVFNKGFLQAGDPAQYTGWGRAEIEAYLRAAYRPTADARHIGNLLLNAVDSLSYNRPRQDAALLVLRAAAPARTQHCGKPAISAAAAMISSGSRI